MCTPPSCPTVVGTLADRKYCFNRPMCIFAVNTENANYWTKMQECLSCTGRIIWNTAPLTHHFLVYCKRSRYRRRSPFLVSRGACGLLTRCHTPPATITPISGRFVVPIGRMFRLVLIWCGRCSLSKFGCFVATRPVVASKCACLLGGRTGSIQGPGKPENVQVLLRLNDLLYGACRVHLFVCNENTESSSS